MYRLGQEQFLSHAQFQVRYQMYYLSCNSIPYVQCVFLINNYNNQIQIENIIIIMIIIISHYHNLNLNFMIKISAVSVRHAFMFLFVSIARSLYTPMLATPVARAVVAAWAGLAPHPHTLDA